MSLYNHEIDVTLTAEQITAISTAITALEEALPFLVSLTPESRRKRLKLGSKSEAFVRDALHVLQNEPAIFPSALSTGEIARDQALRQALIPIAQRLGALLTKVNETSLVAGTDLMTTATAVYRALLATGRGAGMDLTLQTLRQRFDRPSRPQAPEGGGTGGTATNGGSTGAVSGAVA